MPLPLVAMTALDLVVLGISHATAPLLLRERCHFAEPAVRKALERLLARPGVAEAVFFSTCNRTEAYVLTSHAHEAPAALASLFASRAELPATEIAAQSYHFHNHQAVSHLCRLAAGVESLVLGETQILGQLKDAYRLAQECRAAGTVMNRLFSAAFRAGKRVHAETEFGRGAVSVGYAAVELAQKIFGRLDRIGALLIGAGETGELVARHFAGLGGKSLVITNRHLDRAQRLAARYQARPAPFDQLESLIAQADVVITSTSAPEPLISVPLVERALQRRSRPLFLIDIAMPRDVAPEVGALGEVFLHNIDSLQSLVDANLRRRREQMTAVAAILDHEVAQFQRWRYELAAAPVVQELRGAFESVRRQELEKHRAAFSPQDFAAVDRLTEAIINKLLHRPQMALKGRMNADAQALDAADADWHAVSAAASARVALVRELFGLDEDASAKPQASSPKPQAPSLKPQPSQPPSPS